MLIGRYAKRKQCSDNIYSPQKKRFFFPSFFSRKEPHASQSKLPLETPR